MDLLAGLLICLSLLQHINYPYIWWGWASPAVRFSTAKSQLKALHGIYASPYTVKVVDEITALIQKNSSPLDTVYVFPHMPIFYWLANRYPATWALTDFFDVCPDVCAKEDAKRIKYHPPKVVVVQDFTREAWHAHEYVFRKGKLSGQRDIMQAIHQLIRQYAYKEVAVYPSTMPGFTIHVWVR